MGWEVGGGQGLVSIPVQPQSAWPGVVAFRGHRVASRRQEALAQSRDSPAQGQAGSARCWMFYTKGNGLKCRWGLEHFQLTAVAGVEHSVPCTHWSKACDIHMIFLGLSKGNSENQASLLMPERRTSSQR